MKIHLLGTALLLSIACTVTTAQEVPQVATADCQCCQSTERFPMLAAMFAAHRSQTQLASYGSCQKGCCQKGCVQKGCVQKGPVQKGCVQKGCLQQGPVQKGCVQKGCTQKSCGLFGACQKGCVQKGA